MTTMNTLLHHLLCTSASQFPDKEALAHNGRRLTYSEVLRAVQGIAGGLRASGIKRGQRVGIYLDPGIPQVLSIFGTTMAGAVFVPINTQLLADQLHHIARDCRISAIITSADKLPSLINHLPTIASLRFLVVIGGQEARIEHFKVYDFEEFCDHNGCSDNPDIGISKDLAAILYTSGSTGKPKGVMLSHANLVAGARIVSNYLEINASDRILSVLPLTFDAGLNQLTTAFLQGATLVMINFVFARQIVESLAKERITGLAGVPTVWTLLTQPISTLHKTALPALRYITNTGGAMPQSALQILRSILPKTRVYLMYGLTEAFRSTYLPPEELDRRPTSMGKAIPDTEILVLNDNGELCGPGEVGELVHRGPTVSMGYWGNADATARVLRPNPLLPPELGDVERVCYSGDLVKSDEDGFLYYVGRRDTMIKSSGFRISPTEVEEVAFLSGRVRHAAAIGVPDDLLGQAVKLFVVPRDDRSVQLDKTSLLDFCGEHLPRHMVPKFVEVLSELPVTSSGKVDYPSLRRREGIV